MTTPITVTGPGGYAQAPSIVAGVQGGGAQTNTATLAAVAGKTNYLQGFDITGGGATGASIIEVTVTGLLVGTLKFEINIAAGATASMNAQGGFSVRFPEPLPASAVNVAIAVVVPTFGAGNTNAAVCAYGLNV